MELFLAMNLVSHIREQWIWLRRAMAYVIGNLRSEIKVPYALISDGRACLELAAAKANFVRGTFVVFMGDGGFYNNDFSALLRRKRAPFG